MSPSSTKLALFPLQTVLFPGGRLPLRIFEPRYVDLVRQCLREDEPFGVVPIKSGREAGPAAVPHELGTSALIIDWSQGNDGLLHIVARGDLRFRVQRHEVQPNSLIIADVTWMDTVTTLVSSDKTSELKDTLHKFLEKYGAIETFDPLNSLAPSDLVYRLAESLPLPVSIKLELLACADDLALTNLMYQLLDQLLRAAPTQR